eukprot:1311057-Amphidinium_carterae.1
MGARGAVCILVAVIMCYVHTSVVDSFCSSVQALLWFETIVKGTSLTETGCGLAQRNLYEGERYS